MKKTVQAMAIAGIMAVAMIAYPAMAGTDGDMLDEAAQNIDGYETMEHSPGHERDPVGSRITEDYNDARIEPWNVYEDVEREPEHDRPVDDMFGRDVESNEGLPQVDLETDYRVDAEPGVDGRGLEDEPRVELDNDNRDFDDVGRAPVEMGDSEAGVGTVDRQQPLNAKDYGQARPENEAPGQGIPGGEVDPLRKSMGGRGETAYDRCKLLADMENNDSGQETEVTVDNKGNSWIYVKDKDGNNVAAYVVGIFDDDQPSYITWSQGSEDGSGSNDSGSGDPRENKELVDLQLRGGQTRVDYNDTSSPGGWVDPMDDNTADKDGDSKPEDGKSAGAVRVHAAHNIGGDGVKGHHVIDPIDGEGPDDGGELGMHVNWHIIDPIDPILIKDVPAATD